MFSSCAGIFEGSGLILALLFLGVHGVLIPKKCPASPFLLDFRSGSGVSMLAPRPSLAGSMLFSFLIVGIVGMLSGI